MENEQQISSPKIEDFTNPYIEAFNRESIFVDVKILATDKWGIMLDETQKDGRERGLVVSKKGEKVFVSDIFTGLSEKQNDNSHAVIHTPLFPHGLKSLLPGMKDMVFVHTHPMPQKLDHLQTTIFSDTDIASFVNSEDHALIMIDRGGSHLLVRTYETNNQDQLISNNIVQNTKSEIIGKEGKIIDVIKSVSQELSKYGLGYFYTPNLTPDSKGYVEFFDPNKVPEKLSDKNFTALSPDIHNPLHQ